MNVDLSSYSSTHFDRGAGRVKEALWLIVSLLLFRLCPLKLSGLKCSVLRWFGARVGRNVFISADAWIDPAFPELLTLEDQVMLGVGARISLHTFEHDHFEAGRVVLRKGVIVGGFALIGPGVEIGEGSVVAAGAVVGRDVPAGKAAIGNPARVVPLRKAQIVETQPHG